MHQHIRDRRNQYFYKMARLNHLADVLHIEPGLLAAYLFRMRTLPQEGLAGLQSHLINDTKSGDTTQEPTQEARHA